MTEFDGDPAEAEASLRRASEALSALQDELAVAEERAEAIEQEETPATPEAEADETQRMEIVQREIEGSPAGRRLRRAVHDQHHRLLGGPGLLARRLIERAGTEAPTPTPPGDHDVTMISAADLTEFMTRRPELLPAKGRPAAGAARAVRVAVVGREQLAADLPAAGVVDQDARAAGRVEAASRGVNSVAWSSSRAEARGTNPSTLWGS